MGLFGRPSSHALTFRTTSSLTGTWSAEKIQIVGSNTWPLAHWGKPHQPNLYGDTAILAARVHLEPVPDRLAVGRHCGTSALHRNEVDRIVGRVG